MGSVTRFSGTTRKPDPAVGEQLFKLVSAAQSSQVAAVRLCASLLPSTQPPPPWPSGLKNFSAPLLTDILKALLSLHLTQQWFDLWKPALKWIYFHKPPVVWLWWFLMDYRAGGARCGVSSQQVGSSTGSNPLLSALSVSPRGPLPHNVLLWSSFLLLGYQPSKGHISQHLRPDVCYRIHLVARYPT